MILSVSQERASPAGSSPGYSKMAAKASFPCGGSAREESVFKLPQVVERIHSQL